jgi:DNA-binding PadR family transcriptional regulator
MDDTWSQLVAVPLRAWVLQSLGRQNYTASALMQVLNARHRWTYSYSTYYRALSFLHERGMIEPVPSAKPNVRHQPYRITAEGKTWLERIDAAGLLVASAPRETQAGSSQPSAGSPEVVAKILDFIQKARTGDPQAFLTQLLNASDEDRATLMVFLQCEPLFLSPTGAPQQPLLNPGAPMNDVKAAILTRIVQLGESITKAQRDTLIRHLLAAKPASLDLVSGFLDFLSPSESPE